MERTDRRSLYPRGLWIPLYIAATLLCVPAGWAASAPFGVTQRTADVRILIDVSGSMSVTDPDNRRVSALRLMTGLLPGSARAGIWMIDREATALMPVGTADEAWKRAAWTAAGRIHSDGRVADVEDAIRTATRDWQIPDPRYDRHLILLVDGHIDIADTPTENEASRARITGELLDRLLAAGATVHGVGLSDGADHQLLRHLAAATDGRYEYLEKATHLDRAFVDLLVNSVAVNGLALQDNQISVDGSIDEFTLVAFTSPRSPKASLLTPSNEIVDALNPANDVTWRSELGYDLITVTGPAAGTWKIRSQADPDNLVVIESSLSAEIAGLSNNLPVAGSQPVYLRILRHGRPVQDPAFLETLTVSVSAVAGGEMKHQWTATDDGQGSDERAGDGIFTADIEAPADAGVQRLVVTVDGVSFQRAQRRLVAPRHIPVIATLSAARSGNAGEYEISVVPYRELIVPDTLAIAATMTDAEGNDRDFVLPRAAGAQWQQRIRVAADAGRHEILLTVTGKNPDGVPQVFHLEPLIFEGRRVIVSEVTGIRREREPSGDPAPPAEDGEGGSTAGGWFDADELEISDVGWWTVVWQVLLVNLVLVAAGYGGYRLWLRRAARNDAAADTPTGDDDTGNVASDASGKGSE